MEKCSFRDFPNTINVFYSVESPIFRPERHQTHFLGLYCPLKKDCKNFKFWTKRTDTTYFMTFGKNADFAIFLNWCFYGLKGLLNVKRL